jgi:hypothetical protein
VGRVAPALTIRVVEEGLVRGVDLSGGGRVCTLGCVLETIKGLYDTMNKLSSGTMNGDSLTRL